MIYVGNYNLLTEDTFNVFALDGNHAFDATDPSCFVDVTLLDNDSNNALNTSTGGDGLSYDLGAGQVTSLMSSGARYDIVLRYQDGSTGTQTERVDVMQTLNGDVFIVDEQGGAKDGVRDNSIWESGKIVSYDLTFSTRSYGGDLLSSVNSFDAVVCFAKGTLIETSSGHKEIETLQIGDRVKTADNGYQAIRWAGSYKANESVLAAHVKQRPIRIMSGALGGGLPKRDLLVSRQHRVLVRSKIAKRMCGETEVLIPAIKLSQLPGVFVDEDIERVEYFHLLFDQHEIIYAEGAASESLFTGPEALKSVAPEARDEILSMFPELTALDYSSGFARYVPCKDMQKQLVAKHVEKSRPVVENA
ncbi:Hint domain-containing protein [Phaeobacter sp. C3_T13_0]|uniref:Hint domain-containing protein n=1 Tax=Phaeobacter cretensis TaxID=3342641 RepID=UPI0039BC7FA9